MLHGGLTWFVCPEGSVLPRTNLGGYSLGSCCFPQKLLFSLCYNKASGVVFPAALPCEGTHMVEETGNSSALVLYFLCLGFIS